jgi:hypothetical protein
MREWSDAPTNLTKWILDQRPTKNVMDAQRAYGAFVEAEFGPGGRLQAVATVLLTNRECPLRCVMCDLWKNTLDHSTPAEAIPEQIDDALATLPPAEVIKLYNAGNFFDTKAIPTSDWQRIASAVCSFERVIVEAHPAFIGAAALRWRDMISGQLEIAIGLETVHADVLARLNKSMTVDDFQQSVSFCRDHDIDVRCFILLRPPWLDEDEGLTWACRSIDAAFDAGVQCCVIVPTRGGNGAMDALAQSGDFTPPRLQSLEAAVAHGLRQHRGRIFADLWDAKQFVRCPCDRDRIDALQRMNDAQVITLSPACSTCDHET